MNTITTLPQLLTIANVTTLSKETLPAILDTITKNKLTLEGDALKRHLSLINSSGEAMTVVYDKIFAKLQESWDKSDNNSISHIHGLLTTLKSSGVSDSRIDFLIEKIVGNEHQIRQDRGNHGFWLTLVTIAGVIASATVLGKTHIEESNKKHPFWHTR